MSITKGNTTKVNFVRNIEIIHAKKCEFYVGKNANLKSRDADKIRHTKKAYDY